MFCRNVSWLTHEQLHVLSGCFGLFFLGSESLELGNQEDLFSEIPAGVKGDESGCRRSAKQGLMGELEQHQSDQSGLQFVFVGSFSFSVDRVPTFIES